MRAYTSSAFWPAGTYSSLSSSKRINVAADLLEETGLGLLAQVAQLQQLFQHGGRAKLS